MDQTNSPGLGRGNQNDVEQDPRTMCRASQSEPPRAPLDHGEQTEPPFPAYLSERYGGDPNLPGFPSYQPPGPGGLPTPEIRSAVDHMMRARSGGNPPPRSNDSNFNPPGPYLPSPGVGSHEGRSSIERLMLERNRGHPPPRFDNDPSPPPQPYLRGSMVGSPILEAARPSFFSGAQSPPPRYDNYRPPRYESEEEDPYEDPSDDDVDMNDRDSEQYMGDTSNLGRNTPAIAAAERARREGGFSAANFPNAHGNGNHGRLSENTAPGNAEPRRPEVWVDTRLLRDTSAPASTRARSPPRRVDGADEGEDNESASELSSVSSDSSSPGSGSDLPRHRGRRHAARYRHGRQGPHGQPGPAQMNVHPKVPRVLFRPAPPTRQGPPQAGAVPPDVPRVPVPNISHVPGFGPPGGVPGVPRQPPPPSRARRPAIGGRRIGHGGQPSQPGMDRAARQMERAQVRIERAMHRMEERIERAMERIARQMERAQGQRPQQ